MSLLGGGAELLKYSSIILKKMTAPPALNISRFMRWRLVCCPVLVVVVSVLRMNRLRSSSISVYCSVERCMCGWLSRVIMFSTSSTSPDNGSM